MSPTNDADIQRFAYRIGELRGNLTHKDPFLLARLTGATFHPLQANHGNFGFFLWQDQVSLSFPELVATNQQTGQELHLVDQAMLLYYFNTADGTPPTGQWISFSELPDGRFYAQAFQGYTGEVLTNRIEDDQDRFKQAALSLAGVPQSLGDAAFSFQALPRVPLMVVFWRGDEDFPSSFRLLFDSSASHYLPTDGYAILGSALTRRLIKAMQ